MASGVTVSRNDLDAVIVRLELTTPNVTGRRVRVAETSKAKKEVGVDILQQLEVRYTSANRQTTKVT
jgi:hypothetical protein